MHRNMVYNDGVQNGVSAPSLRQVLKACNASTQSSITLFYAQIGYFRRCLLKVHAKFNIKKVSIYINRKNQL